MESRCPSYFFWKFVVACESLRKLLSLQKAQKNVDLPRVWNMFSTTQGILAGIVLAMMLPSTVKAATGVVGEEKKTPLYQFFIHPPFIGEFSFG
jgi:hypothetical protein